VTTETETLPPPDSPPNMLPGVYLAKRREAAGLSRADLALLLATELARPAHPADRGSFETKLEKLEGGLNRPATGTPLETASRPRPFEIDWTLIDMIRRQISFDQDTFFALVGVAYFLNDDGGVVVPFHCRSCGCSWNDPCKGGCAWANQEATLCTACRDLPSADVRAAGEAVPA